MLEDEVTNVLRTVGRLVYYKLSYGLIKKKSYGLIYNNITANIAFSFFSILFQMNFKLNSNQKVFYNNCINLQKKKLNKKLTSSRKYMFLALCGLSCTPKTQILFVIKLPWTGLRYDGCISPSHIVCRLILVIYLSSFIFRLLSRCLFSAMWLHYMCSYLHQLYSEINLFLCIRYTIQQSVLFFLILIVSKVHNAPFHG